MAKKNSKKNKFKSKDRFRNSIISNESITLNKVDDVDSVVGNNVSTATASVTSTKVQSLGSELKLIGIIGISLFTILIIFSFVI